MFKTAFATFLGIVLLAGLLVGATELSFQIYQHYSPKYEGVRRETYEQSRAFREGTIRQLEAMELAYADGNDAQKAAIRSVALEQLADVPNELLTPDLRAFRAHLAGGN